MIQSIEAAQVITLLTAVGAPVFAVGGAFFAVKYGLNGARRDIADIKHDTRELRAGQENFRVAVAETRQEIKDMYRRIGALEER